MSGTSTLRVDGREIESSNRDKVFFPDEGITKGELVDYYARVAGTMLPHVRDRAISMERFPDGIAAEGFYQKEVPPHFPEWIDRVTLEKEEGEITQVVVRRAASLVYLADQACITPHAWASRVDRPRRPDRLIFDLDPPGSADGLRLLKNAARDLRELLRGLGLVPYLMTTGSRGLHVVAPIARRHGFDEARAVARGAAELLAARAPGRYTTEIRKAKRGDRLFIDVMRNGYAQTGVAPYAVRARPGAPVATPLGWDELDRSGMGPARYTIRNLFRRLGQRDDPWAAISDDARPLGSARDELRKLRETEGPEGTPG